MKLSQNTDAVVIIDISFRFSGDVHDESGGTYVKRGETGHLPHLGLALACGQPPLCRTGQQCSFAVGILLHADRFDRLLWPCTRLSGVIRTAAFAGNGLRSNE